MRGSLTRELMGISVGLVAGTVLLCWFLNATFIEKFYLLNKENTLRDGFYTIDAAADRGELMSGSFDVTFDNLCANGNITIMVISSDRTIVRSSANNNQTVLVEFLNILFGNPDEETFILEDANHYVIQRQRNTRLDSEYLILYGTLSNGNLILMRSALESIRESANISSRFLAFVGTFAIIVSSVIIIFVSRRIMVPILELTDISQKMTELDFEAKYHCKKKRKNEIDELGEHFNRLSVALEDTISELKTANIKLQKDIEEKIQIDEMRKEFLSNVSHELKTPLALIQGYAEGLSECIHDDPESRQFYCEVITDETDKMNRMVKKLLSLNQLEFGNEDVVMERFDLTELISGIAGANSILLSSRQTELEFDETAPCYVWADEFKVEEVLTNYVSNAIHHVKYENKIRIFYTKKRDCVRVSVFNTGDPIPEEETELIWTKFYKVDKARTREYGGSGIGLSIVKAIMQSMRRECGVINRENGVEFWFELDIGSQV